MIGDPNWLYSTIAQSSAAIVAIVGGFITATVLMLTVEKRSLFNQLREKKERLGVLKMEYTKMIAQFRGHQLSDEHRKEDLERQISILESEVANLETRLKTFSYPPNLRWGAAVLGYLTVFGILFPVIAIFREAYSDILRMLITSSFYIGIIGLFAYVIYTMRTLRR